MGWFKVWDDEWLERNSGLDLEVQGAMVRVLCSVNRCIDEGRFSFRQKMPLSIEQILGDTGLDLEMWKRLEESGFVVKVGEFWVVQKFKKYQSEYQRQKGYREKLRAKVTTKGYRPK